MTFDDIYFRAQPIVAQVANEYARKFHGFGADGSDFGQEFLLWMHRNQAMLVEQFELLGDERFDRYLAKCLRNEAVDYGLDIKAQALGYERQDLYFYSIGELKVLLDCVFDRQKWLEPPQSDGSRSAKRPAEGNNWVATLADVADGFSKLKHEDQELLRDHHERGWTNRELAKLHGVSESVQSYRHGAACKRLQEKLGGPAPKPMRKSETDPAWRGRRAISNATARAITSNSYDE